MYSCRYAVFLLALALCACTPPMRGATTTAFAGTKHPLAGACDVRKLSKSLGLVADDALIERLRIEAGATTVRVLRPGIMITNEVNPARLNLRMDNARKILVYSCG